MNGPPYFPSATVGWIFFLILMGFTVVAAWRDLKTRTIPKWIPLALLAVGIALQVTRGAWLGSQGETVWIFGAQGAALGALDAFLFAASGFVVGFAAFFAMWILRICGGGDVKLFAAVGVWIGPRWALWVLLGSTVVLVTLSMAWMLWAMVTRGPMVAASNPKAASSTANSRGMTYSFPLAAALCLMMLWFWRYDLQLAQRPTTSGSTAKLNAI